MGDEALLFHPQSKQYFVLSGPARRVWELSDGSHTQAAIARTLASEFQDPVGHSRYDADETISGLGELGLLEISS